MARRLVTYSAAVSLAARELGKLSWQKRKAREDERNARLAELEAENARLRALLGEKSSYSKSRVTS
jgi:cell shape-determining protein MreC